MKGCLKWGCLVFIGIFIISLVSVWVEDYGSYFTELLKENRISIIIIFLIIIMISLFFLQKRCLYCNKRSGLFKNHHKKCLDKYTSSTSNIDSKVDEYFKRFIGKNLENIDNESEFIFKEEEYTKITEIAKEGYIDLNRYLVTLLSLKIDEFLEDDILSVDEETALAYFIENFKLNEEMTSGYRGKRLSHRIVRNTILRDLMDGKVVDLEQYRRNMGLE